MDATDKFCSEEQLLCVEIKHRVCGRRGSLQPRAPQLFADTEDNKEELEEQKEKTEEE